MRAIFHVFPVFPDINNRREKRGICQYYEKIKSSTKWAHLSSTEESFLGTILKKGMSDVRFSSRFL